MLCSQMYHIRVIQEHIRPTGGPLNKIVKIMLFVGLHIF